MKKVAAVLCVLAISGHSAAAGGLDFTGQPLRVIYEDGNLVELGYTSARPDISGQDRTPFATDTGGVVGRRGNPSFAVKLDLSDTLAAALIYEQPYMLALGYPGFSGFAETGSYMLGDTQARVDSDALIAILRKKLDGGFALHGGLQASRISGAATLAGVAYGPAFDPSDPGTYASINGYHTDLEASRKLGYILGASYEKPEIGLRVALTYYSAIAHDMDTVETLPAGAAILLGTDRLFSTTRVKLPQALNLDLQTGIAEDTALFASVRWADWSAFRIDTAWLMAASGSGLADLRDSVSYVLGIGHRFSDDWSGSVFALYEAAPGRRNTPLMPTNGYRGIGTSLAYRQENMKVTLGATWLAFGDAKAETGPPFDVRTEMKGHATNIGVKVAFYF